MKRFFALPAFAVLLLFAIPAQADPSGVPERILGKADAPVTVEEYISLTCPHCAEFYTDVLPKLQAKYIDSGKVRFILRDFPLDGAGLRAASLARCMPEDEFYPFIDVLYKNQRAWATAPDPDKILVQYARLGGLAEDKAKSCLTDSKMQDAIIAIREDATKKYNIQATPTFVINNGVDRIEGSQPADKFGLVLDKALAGKK